MAELMMDCESARAALTELDRAAGRTRTAAVRQLRGHAAFAIAIGLAMGIYEFVCLYALPRSQTVWAVAFVAYLVGIVVLVLVFNRARRATYLAWEQGYRWALGISLVPYLIGIALSVGTHFSLGASSVFAGLTAAPLVGWSLWCLRTLQ